MQCGRPAGTDCEEREQKWDPSVSASTPELCVGGRVSRLRDKLAPDRERDPRRTPRAGHSASESNLSARQNDSAAEDKIPIEPKSIAGGDEKPLELTVMQRCLSPSPRQHGVSPKQYGVASPTPMMSHQPARKPHRYEKMGKCCLPTALKKSRSCAMDNQMQSVSPVDSESAILRQVRDIHNDMRSSARIIKDSRARLVELQKKSHMNDLDVKELSDRHELLLREMERFDKLTRNVQRLVDHEVVALRKVRDTPRGGNPMTTHNPGYEPVMYHEMKMQHPTVALGHAQTAQFSPPTVQPNDVTRSKSEIDLTRKLNESYDMQEKLVADNADLEVKRYILYKELMTKDQNLETCRAQIKRLQGELKLMSKENALLHEKISRNCPEGDASSIDHDPSKKKETQQKEKPQAISEKLASRLESFRISTSGFENQLEDLEAEVSEMKDFMDQLRKLAEDTSRAGAGKPACRTGTCITPASKPVPTKGSKCGICPPCPAPCNPSEPPTPAEKEVAKLTIQLKTLDENYRTKVTECSILRADSARKKEELDNLKVAHKEMTVKLKEVETQLQTMQAHHNMMMGTKDQANEVEVNVRLLKQCYREAREEIDELRLLLKEQNEQLQNYRSKYMSSMQTVEEQKRMMENMDMDNSRVSEQINLEIQKIKNNFQEKLLEVAPIPEMLQKTQDKLKNALTAQAMAEHKADKLAIELNIAREKIHNLMYNYMKPPEYQGGNRDEKLIEVLQQRITQLTQSNQALKDEIERLKTSIIRMEEAVIVNETRLSEKMTECAQLGGELDAVRDEAARAVVRANERVETWRQLFQTNKAEMERKLIASLAQLRIAEKDCQEIQCRMQCQIKKLKENYEAAQVRILGLTTTIAKLRQGMDHGDDNSESTEDCLCGMNIV